MCGKSDVKFKIFVNFDLWITFATSRGGPGIDPGRLWRSINRLNRVGDHSVGLGAFALGLQLDRQNRQTRDAEISHTPGQLGLRALAMDRTSAAIAVAHQDGDPFDRLLATQMLVEGTRVISADAVLDQYGVRLVWS
jgi:hypothetical protein